MSWKLGEYMADLASCKVENWKTNKDSEKVAALGRITRLHPEMCKLTVGEILDIALPTSPSSMLDPEMQELQDFLRKNVCRTSLHYTLGDYIQCLGEYREGRITSQTPKKWPT